MPNDNRFHLTAVAIALTWAEAREAYLRKWSDNEAWSKLGILLDELVKCSPPPEPPSESL